MVSLAFLRTKGYFSLRASKIKIANFTKTQFYYVPSCLCVCTEFPNRRLCERLLPIFKKLVSLNIFLITNNIKSYLLEELNIKDRIVYKADRWHAS